MLIQIWLGENIYFTADLLLLFLNASDLQWEVCKVLKWLSVIYIEWIYGTSTKGELFPFFFSIYVTTNYTRHIHNHWCQDLLSWMAKATDFVLNHNTYLKYFRVWWGKISEHDKTAVNCHSAFKTGTLQYHLWIAILQT